jgi:hypothetical protein
MPERGRSCNAPASEIRRFHFPTWLKCVPTRSPMARTPQSLGRQLYDSRSLRQALRGALGTYQLRSVTSPVSSLNRVYMSGDSERKKMATRRMQMFFDWVKKIPELHYDFMTDPGVAGFFAADTKVAAEHWTSHPLPLIHPKNQAPRTLGGEFL